MVKHDGVVVDKDLLNTVGFKASLLANMLLHRRELLSQLPMLFIFKVPFPPRCSSADFLYLYLVSLITQRNGSLDSQAFLQ